MLGCYSLLYIMQLKMKCSIYPPFQVRHLSPAQKRDAAPSQIEENMADGLRT